MSDTPRLIEHAFPLKQASLDSVHEKNVRHGHISTLHIWPARRPLAACRAALIATLLPDPSAQRKPEGMSEEEWHKEIIRRRKELCEKIGGKVVKKIERKKMPNGQTVEREKEITEGRHPALGPGDGKQGNPGLVPAGDPQGLRRARAEGAGSVRGRRGDSAGGHAPGVRGDRRGHQPGRVVHSEMHARIPAEAGRTRRILCRTSSSKTKSS